MIVQKEQHDRNVLSNWAFAQRGNLELEDSDLDSDDESVPGLKVFEEDDDNSMVDSKVADDINENKWLNIDKQSKLGITDNKVQFDTSKK